MDNREMADQLRQFADLLEIKGENPFRINAYRRAAETLEQLEESVQEMVAAGTLTGLPGIGPGITAALKEMAETGHYTVMDELLDEVPATLLTLLDVSGVGPKTAGRLYRELGITDLVQLEAAAEAGRVRELKGFGKRHEERILEGIAFLNRRTHRMSIGIALPLAEMLAATLADSLDEPVQIAGSVRRMCETVGNIDLVASVADPRTIQALLADVPGVTDVELTGSSRVVSATSDHGVTLRIVGAQPGLFGAELVWWTGSRDHVEQLIRMAGGDLPAAAAEVDVYERLGLPWIPPEIREARGEIELATQGHLPELVTVPDIRGDLHLHSEWSDGRATLEELAKAAVDRGYEYLSISDHSGSLQVAHGLDVERLRAQRREIDRVNEMFPEVRLLRSSEVEVRTDGTLDFPNEVLANLDIVVASLHSGSRQGREERTRRIVSVLRNPHVDIVAHPTGRIINRRPGGEYDWDEVFRVASETGTALEINSSPARLDLSEDIARAANEAGVHLVIDSDAHDLATLDIMRYGVAVARRAGIKPGSVLNTRNLSGLMDWLRR